MALKIFWSKRADRKFDAIVSYLEKEWGAEVSRVFVNRVYEFLDIAVLFPEIGSLENPDRGIRGFVIVKQITIFYKVKTNRLILLNFFDNRQDPFKKKF